MDQVKLWYRGLQPRERMLVATAGALIGIAILYLALFGPFAKALHTREQRVASKRQDLVWMRSVASAVRAASHRGGGASNESLVVVVNRSAQQAGIIGALTNQSPQGANSIRVRIEGAQFDATVNWLGLLEQQYGVRVESASIDRSEKAGLINASIVLARGS